MNLVGSTLCCPTIWIFSYWWSNILTSDKPKTTYIFLSKGLCWVNLKELNQLGLLSYTNLHLFAKEAGGLFKRREFGYYKILARQRVEWRCASWKQATKKQTSNCYLWQILSSLLLQFFYYCWVYLLLDSFYSVFSAASFMLTITTFWSFYSPPSLEVTSRELTPISTRRQRTPPSMYSLSLVESTKCLVSSHMSTLIAWGLHFHLLSSILPWSLALFQSCRVGMIFRIVVLMPFGALWLHCCYSCWTGC